MDWASEAICQAAPVKAGGRDRLTLLVVPDAC